MQYLVENWALFDMAGCLLDQQGGLTSLIRTVLASLPLAVFTSTHTSPEKRAAMDIKSGRNGKDKGHAQVRGPRHHSHVSLGHWASNTWDITHTQSHMLVRMPANLICIWTLTFRIFLLSFSDTLSPSLWHTHTLWSSMVSSDTKLMPCHTGCQQISQWITPQPLDVHRAKGHKHGRERERRKRESETVRDWQW